MPVLSPHRSSASGLSGTYRSTYNSSALDRPFFGSSSYTPRTSSYSERYTSRSYTDSAGRRIFSRSGSVTEDGVTTARFREESREPSVSRTPERDHLGPSSRRREASLSRVDVCDSVAELRNKYSPANYVPACLRARRLEGAEDNGRVARSKSINDIGLPPIESKTAKKKVTTVAIATVDHRVTAASTNNTNAADRNPVEDLNGNRESVADLRKKFDDSETVVGIGKKGAATVNVKKKWNTKLEVNGEENHVNGGPSEADDRGEELSEGERTPSRSGSRVNDFASYISARDLRRGDDDSSDSKDGHAKNDMDNKDQCVGKSTQLNDLSTPPSKRIVGNGNRSPPSSSTSGNVNANSIHRQRDFSDDDSGGERSLYRGYNATNRSLSSPVKVLGLNGLKNIGNTCFMNSVIQCLSHTRWLLEYLRNDAYLKDINTTMSGMKGALIRAFAEVIKELWSEEAADRVVNTASLKGQIQRFAPRFIGYAQQDAQEFLRYLLEGLHEDVNRVAEKPRPIVAEIDDKLSDNEKASESWSRYLRLDNSKIVDHFVGQLRSTLRCTQCGHCSVTFDPFWDLSLPMPQRTGQLRLAQCLDSFTREETLDGDEKPTCAKCKERRKCTKSFSIHKFPKILVIHLKRFSPTERFRGKLNVTVDFPLDGLDMSRYASEGASPTSRYTLYAVSNHSGTTYSGHYTAYCRHPYARDSWHEYNDSRVTPISPKSIVSGEAYVLFYQQEGSKSHL